MLAGSALVTLARVIRRTGRCGRSSRRQRRPAPYVGPYQVLIDRDAVRNHHADLLLATPGAGARGCSAIHARHEPRERETSAAFASGATIALGEPSAYPPNRRRARGSRTPAPLSAIASANTVIGAPLALAARTGYNTSGLECLLLWPVLACPPKARFEVSTEVDECAASFSR